MNPTINKFLVAIATVITTLVVMLGDNDIDSLTTGQWLTLAVVALGAIGIYGIPNAAKTPASPAAATTTTGSAVVVGKPKPLGS